jgi:glutathione S-transferase
MIKLYAAKAPWEFLKGVIRDLRPTWLLEEMGIPYERVLLDPMKGETKSPSYLGVNPFGKIPSIDDDGFLLSQSAVVCEYLADKYGKLIPPAGTQDRFKHNQWMFFAMSDIEPRTVAILRARNFLGADESEQAKWLEADAKKTLKFFFGILDQELSKKEYLMGSEFQVADLMLTAVMSIIWKDPLFDEFANLKGYLAKNMARPAFKKAFEMNGI